MDGHHQHARGHDHHEHARTSTVEERALYAPFTDDLHAFLRVALEGVDGTIAEVGAGDGVIAQRLREDGFDVIAIDANPITAESATEQGRPVLHADWRSWDGGGKAPFDALLFTRSLHHIDPIEHATDQIARLAPGGLLIADEFGFERVDAAGAQLLADARALSAAAGVSTSEAIAIGDPLQAWKQFMTVDHPIVASDRLLEAVRQVASIEQIGYGRFISGLVTYGLDATHPQAGAVRDVVIATEDARIAAGTLEPSGMRFTARIGR